MLINIALSILLLSSVSPAYAATSANVEIHNNVSSNSNSDSQTNSYTNITVETNGKVTRYESDQPGEVSVKSVNGESSIKVNGQEVSPTISTAKSTSTPSPAITKAQAINKQTNEFRNRILEQLKKPFRILRAIFFFLH